HKNILKFIGYHLTRDLSVAFLVSPYFVNGNVREYLCRTPAASLEEKLKLVQDTACGLEYLHTRNPPVLHGDLKAVNVLINEGREAVLCDFGLTTVMNERTDLTTATGFKGTMRWCPLDVILGARQTLESDIWSWGCLVMEIITGNYPYSEFPTEGAIVLSMHQEKRTPWPLNDYVDILPGRLFRLVKICWSFEAKDRPHASTCMSEMDEIIVLELPLWVIFLLRKRRKSITKSNQTDIWFGLPARV
ncbi:hypothetical protein M407DRAFT_78833, partial [Tulasnella calospora MUT 4182]